MSSHLEADLGLGSVTPPPFPAVSVTKWGLFGSELLRSNWDQGGFHAQVVDPLSSLSLLISHLSSFCRVLADCYAGGGDHQDHRGGALPMDILIYGLEEYDHGLYHIIYIMEWQPNLILRYYMIAHNYL